MVLFPVAQARSRFVVTRLAKSRCDGFFTAGFTLLAHVPDPGESAFSYAECPLPGIRPIRPRIRMIRKGYQIALGRNADRFRPPLPNHVADSSAHHLPAYSPTAVRSGNANASDRRFGISNPTRNHPQKSDRLPLTLGPQEERKRDPSHRHRAS